MEPDPFIKIIVVGEQGVGKTCLLNQFCYSRFEQNSAPTIGCDFTTKVTNQDGQTIRLQLWDIAGQEKYNAVSKLYVRGALGCVIVCDITDHTSLEETLKWKTIIEENSDRQKGIPTILVQNKSDLVNEPNAQQTESFLKSFAQENQFFDALQTSAKENKGLKELFQKLIKKILDDGLLLEQQQNFKKSTTGTVLLQNQSVNPTQQSSSGGCC